MIRKTKTYKLFSKVLLVIPIILLFVPGIFSQEVTQIEDVTVISTYEPSVTDVLKINISPKIPEEKIEKPEFNYSIKSTFFETPVSLTPLVPAKITGESVSKLYKNYIKAGIGNYGTPYLEVFANQLRSKKSAFGVHLKHLSSSGKIKDYAYPGNSNTNLSVFGKRFMKNHTLSANAFFKRTGVHYYGYIPDEFPEISLSKKDIKQSFNLFGLNTEFESNYTRDSKLNHFITFDYYYLSDRFEAKEHNILLKAGVNKHTEFFSFSEIEKLGIEAGVDYYLNSDTLLNHNSGIVEVNPFYSLGFEQYKFKVGLNTATEIDTNTKLHFYPTIHLEVKVVKDYLVTYAGIGGNLQKNSFKFLSEKNPFVISTVEKRFSNEKFSQYGGIKGRISKYLDYNLSFVNSTIENMPFFVNDTASVLGEGLNNQFTVLYDRVKYSRIIAEFGFHYKNKFNATLRGKYHNYFLDNEEKPWHKPTLEIALMADYNMQDKIIIRGEIFTRSKMYARTFEEVNNGTITTISEVPVEMDGMFDVNLGVEYRYTKLLSGFINFNNILGQRYYKWYNYPSYRFNMMLGVTYSF